MPRTTNGGTNTATATTAMNARLRTDQGVRGVVMTAMPPACAGGTVQRIGDLPDPPPISLPGDVRRSDVAVVGQRGMDQFEGEHLCR
jgi:hypothetical protein